ncbi:insulin-like growth factor-binding protein complex acid labile subunit [Argiope bruennichi]|uniref:insulin-like growth factor-binding protein complex acid labile subunit n=1 Tax=Argiope bruennichi TaxID=94029 RepID=UPI0024946134|nr:insulin-like growth factor-binding protein complex acid labile subunit [Argiope bruennichi]XP_055925351.1 insulin-like growth factor-binding protein complex acid labile subunit [Argiope bruennichi]XP_055925352.1 insulin-like growth factor-binding protein complex acid labile subunit [Argiope bruennichi]
MDRTTFYALLTLLSCLPHAFSRCPKQCSCVLKSGKKVVFCSSGNMTLIPVSEMDINIHELVITAPPNSPNNLTIGRIFLKFTNLETVRITRSGVPAIGDSSFWPGRRLKVLDLSCNSISFLRESDFNGLKNLQELDLSDNDIFAAPSAPFRHLLNLKKLNLARNKLVVLVPRFFYLLSNLEELDLSGNTLGQIEPENLQDVKILKVLKLARCRLSEIHPIVYQQLPLLEELDLSDNYITTLAPSEFRHLPNLSVLHLDGNVLSSITEGTFHGHKFKILGLSRNNLSSLSEHAFTNTSIKMLDLSHNRLEYVLEETTQPLSDILEILNISYNDLGNQAFYAMVHPLKNLKILQATDLLVKNLSPGLFDYCKNLRLANFSRNGLSDIPLSVILELENIEELDLSYNLFSHVDETTLEAFSNLTFLRTLHLKGNPIDCSGCLIMPLYHALNESQFFDPNCSNENCVQCNSPADRSGICVKDIPPETLYCHAGKYDRHYLVYTSQVGLIVAVSIIVVIVCIILVIIIIYKRHIAHYYTHEEEQRAWKGMYENPALAPSGGVHYSDDKPTFISSTDKVDENIDDLRRPHNIMR